MESAFKGIIIFLVGVLVGVVGHRYAGKKCRTIEDEGPVITNSTDIKSLIEPNTLFGIDLSKYSGKVTWKSVKANDNIKYAIVRSTMGDDGVDVRFAENWEELDKLDIVRGAYHYFRPGKNLDAQFENFKSKVKFKPGDIRPIFDIETSGDLAQSEIVSAVNKWSEFCVNEWGVKPIIYTGLNFYRENLKDAIDSANLWLASYTKNSLRKSGIKCTIHQFSDKIAIKGLRERVDGNMFFGDSADFQQLCLN
jgi:lysozyme